MCVGTHGMNEHAFVCTFIRKPELDVGKSSLIPLLPYLLSMVSRSNPYLTNVAALCEPAGTWNTLCILELGVSCHEHHPDSEDPNSILHVWMVIILATESSPKPRNNQLFCSPRAVRRQESSLGSLASGYQASSCSLLLHSHLLKVLPPYVNTSAAGTESTVV